jgi:hypothetical protein
MASRSKRPSFEQICRKAYSITYAGHEHDKPSYEEYRLRLLRDVYDSDLAGLYETGGSPKYSTFEEFQLAMLMECAMPAPPPPKQ